MKGMDLNGSFISDEFVDMFNFIMNKSRVDVVFKMQSGDETAQICKSYQNSRAALEKILHDEAGEISGKNKKTIERFIEETTRRGMLEGYEMYLHGFFDCVKLMNTYGWIK